MLDAPHDVRRAALAALHRPIVPNRSGAPATGLPAVDLRPRTTDHLGAVGLLAHRPVLSDALVVGLLAVEGLAHLRLQVLVVGLLVRHPLLSFLVVLSTLAPPRNGVQQDSPRAPNHGPVIVPPVRDFRA